MDSCSSDVDDSACWKVEERREPLGAACDEDYRYDEAEMMSALDIRGAAATTSDDDDEDRVRALEDEQEALSASLFALTSHLAQVQLRLRQIVAAPADANKEPMLRALDEFASRGVPDLGSVVLTAGLSSAPSSAQPSACAVCRRLDERLRDLRPKRPHLVERLARQLRELEQIGEAAGKGDAARRDAIVESLRRSIGESLDEARHQPFTADELRHRAACAAASAASFPRDDAQEMVDRLQAQVEDMQRFIGFIKSGGLTPPHPNPDPPQNKNQLKERKNSTATATERSPKSDQLRAETVNLMKKIVALLQMFAVAQFGCTTDKFRHNDLKRTHMGNHWGDLRARLEMSIDAVLSLVRHGDSRTGSAVGDYDSDSEENPVVLPNVPLAIAVRKHLAINIRDLVQHGLAPSSETMNGLVPFVGCFPRRSLHHQRHQMHAWELVLRYYEMSNGELYNSTPARRLSQSFNLDIVGSTAVSSKESMLSAIGSIIASHKPYKRSYDSHFKAFVCAGLNANKLVQWLNVIFKNKAIMKMFYAPTSYAANTGFQDSLQSLDRLTAYKFDLPVDLAVRQFQNIKDVFM